jgi:non-heme chloroperoxidase
MHPPSSELDFSSLSQHYQSVPPLKEFRARDGEKISYRSYDSSKEDRVMILLHGSSAHGEYLHPLAEHLKALGKVYVPNLRGHYLSGSVRGDCSYIGQMEDDFVDLIDHCGLRGKKIYVVGHSSGGGLAIRLAGGPYGKCIQGFILLSPAIPTAPTMRQGTAGGWAKVSFWKIILFSVLNRFGIRFLNHVKVIQFNMPPKYCDGTETLSYSYNLNTSYHPRLPYQKDIAALKNRGFVLVGSEDKAMDPLQYPKVMQDPHSISIQIIQGSKHLNLVHNLTAFHAVTQWIETHE